MNAYIDHPLTEALTLEIMSAVATTLHQQEPRITLTKVGVTAKNPSSGHLTLRLEGLYDKEPFVEEDVTL